MMFPKPWLAMLLILSLALGGCLSATGDDTPTASPQLDAWSTFPAPQGEAPLMRAADALQAADARLFDGLPTQPEALPSVPLRDALLGLAADNGQTLGLEETLALDGLVLVPEATAAAVSDVVQAFRVLQRETTSAYGTEAPALDRVAGAQHLVMETVTALDEAVARSGTASLGMGPISFINVFSLDLSGSTTNYWIGYHLVIDLGGADTYYNNAGGNSVSDSHCDTAIAPTAAALVDLAGDDRYVADRDCGVAGGAAYGAGLLIDGSGDDVYDNGGRGTHGGAYANGIGLLVDADGADTYLATGAGTNGGGYAGGIGRLIDLAGDDHYEGFGDGVNGGGRSGYHCLPVCQMTAHAQGLLLDLGGTDLYRDSLMRDRIDASAIPKEYLGFQIDLALTA